MITRILNKITFVLFIGILGVFAGCNDEDDIEAIFIGQTWYVGDFYTTTNPQEQQHSNDKLLWTSTTASKMQNSIEEIRFG